MGFGTPAGKQHPIIDWHTLYINQALHTQVIRRGRAVSKGSLLLLVAGCAL